MRRSEPEISGRRDAKRAMAAARSSSGWRPGGSTPGDLWLEAQMASLVNFFPHWYERIPVRVLVRAAAFGLSALGFLCLCLSALVAPTGSWWQGTLDAFGVGFVVGGVVDVLAIFGLNHIVVDEDRRREQVNQQARQILEMGFSKDKDAFKEMVLSLADEWGLMDPNLQIQLMVQIQETRG